MLPSSFTLTTVTGVSQLLPAFRVAELNIRSAKGETSGFAFAHNEGTSWFFVFKLDGGCDCLL